MLLYHLGCWTASVGSGWGIRPAVRFLAVAAGVSALTVLAVWALLQPLVPALGAPVAAWLEWGLVPPRDLGFLVYYALVNPWIEEAFWRGRLLGAAARNRLGVVPARTLSVFGFLPMHIVVLSSSFEPSTTLLMSCAVLVGSLAWTWMQEKCRTTWLPAASHMGADLGLVIAYLVWLRPAR
jgi:hypothetical protein